MIPSDNLVFISYAREDKSWAERLYMDLRKQEINAWLDVKCIPPGANWEYEIRKAIRASKYYILLVSKHSINKRGFIQKELKEAIDVLQEYPKGSIFIIPARLDETTPIDDELKELNWVELAPVYYDGLSRMMSLLTSLKKAPLDVVTGSNAPFGYIDIIDKGEKIKVEAPLMLGPRAVVSYAPFRTRIEYLKQFLDRLPPEGVFSDPTISYYFTIDTRHENTQIGDDLKIKYPEYITLVLQFGYRQLSVREEGFSVVLLFDDIEREIAIPYSAILQIRIPEIGMTISFD